MPYYEFLWTDENIEHVVQHGISQDEFEYTDEEKRRLAQSREQFAQELPDLQMRDQMRKDAREEATLSGGVRRAVHASDLSLRDIATQAGITPIMLDDFLTGERTLRSDVMDRLASVLGYKFGPEASRS